MRKIADFRNGILAAAVLCLIVSGCASFKDNSDRSLQELANHMITQVGGTVDGKVFPAPVKAMDGISIRVEGREVFFYMYDPKLKKQKFKAAVNGCFVMIEHETNIKKKELLTAFEKF